MSGLRDVMKKLCLVESTILTHLTIFAIHRFHDLLNKNDHNLSDIYIGIFLVISSHHSIDYD